jgi:flagellar basal body-associated protein FliL
MKITKASTKTELIKNALINIIQKNKLKELKKYKGALNLEIDLDKLRDRNESFSR